jgi:hypothetical protein
VLLDKKEIESLLNSSWVMDFANITLTRKNDKDTSVYSGPGSISQSNDGLLELKMYHVYESQEEMNHEMKGAFRGNELTAGKIIEEHYYYSLEAIDISGKKWETDNVWPSGHMRFPSAGRVIEASLDRVTNTSVRREQEDLSKTYASLFIPGIYELPCNELEKTESSSSSSIYSLDLASGDCKIKKRDQHLEISTNISQGLDPELFSSLLLEALSVGIGSYMRPLVKIVTHQKNRTTTIYSRQAEKNGKTIPPPIPTNRVRGPHALSQFVNKYLATFTEPYSPIFGYWFRIVSQSTGELENKALVFTTSIEGVLKEYYSKYGLPDGEFLKEVSSATKLITDLDIIGARAKSRLLSTLGNAKASTPKNALYALANKKLIPDELIEIWVELRNKSAHADELKQNKAELQEFLDQTFGCLELFYLLLMIHIGYVGDFIQYSKEDWPIATRTVGE